MCGICGILSGDGQPVAAELLHRMTAVLQHRGPDDAGYYQDPGIGLGFRRLSIIDLSGGRQPMANEDETVWLVFNGEIYNFKDLRAELRQAGHVFKTNADTEVIVHGYEQWGDEVVQRLNGMFAFAIWDRHHRRLLLARDRLGIKPLFYAFTGHSLAFASEIKSLLLWPELDPAINDRGVYEYFSQHFVPGTQTFYTNISKLQPGARLSMSDGRLVLDRYWRPQVRTSARRSLEDWSEELRQRLLQAVDLQMVADVPLGVFLSGGLDSSAVTAAMARTGGNTIRSFNIGFDVKHYDETTQAQLISRHLGTEHETFRLTEWPTQLLPRLLWHLDEPMADATILPTYVLSKMTRKHVTVALSGEGGDELFAGYTHYQGLKINGALQKLPGSWRRLALSVLPRLPSFGSSALSFFLHRLERIIASADFPLYEGYLRKVAFFSPEDQRQLFAPEFREHIKGLPYLADLHQVPGDSPELDPVYQANLADLSIFLPEDLLVKVDRMSMACSLEVRVPLLDHTLVEFALSLPLELKLSGLTTKYLFRQALQPWLPASIVRRPKRGFNPPLEFWLQGHLEAYFRENRLLESIKDSGYLNVDYIRQLMAAHVSGRRNYARQLWSILIFGLWWQSIRGKGECPV